MSFDMEGNGELIVGDAGQDMFEEISVVTKGGNYGWNVFEGTRCFNAASPINPFNTCPDVVGEGHPLEGDPLIGPVIELMNASTFEEEGVVLVVIGGYVYRGSSLPSDFEGDYIFGVWSRGEEETEEGEVHHPGRILVASPQEEAMWPWEELEIANADRFPHFILSFGQDAEGDVYVLTTDEVGPSGETGRVYRIVAEGSGDVGLVSSADEEVLPNRLTLEQNYPNPFNPTTAIRFQVGVAEHVRLSVYDVLGRRVAVLHDGAVAPGSHTVMWDGRDAAGKEVGSGTYVYRVESDTHAESKMMTLVR